MKIDLYDRIFEEMYKEYPLNNVSTWYGEPLEAVGEFLLMTDGPDGDDEEPYEDVEDEAGTGRRWRRVS
jgi:hypothetical protein